MNFPSNPKLRSFRPQRSTLWRKEQEEPNRPPRSQPRQNRAAWLDVILSDQRRRQVILPSRRVEVARRQSERWYRPFRVSLKDERGYRVEQTTHGRTLAGR